MNLNIECLKKACAEENVQFESYDVNENFIGVHKNGKVHYFHNHVTPLNSQIVAQICKDKEFSYLLLKDVITMPYTKGYFDPHTSEVYDKYKHYPKVDKVICDIQTNFEFPLIIKKNSGSVGRNVFLCHSLEDIKNAVSVIYDKSSHHYDFELLAQKYINIKKEYRVVVLNKKISFLYLKDNSQASFKNNLSPLHWDNAQAVLINDVNLQEKIQEFINPIFSKLNLLYTGLDIAEDIDGKLWLIELNSSPGFSYFVKDNKERVIIDFYKEVLNTL